MSANLTNQQAWAAASAWGRESRMNELEALMWRSERHPRQSSTITALMLLDSVPDWPRLRAAHQWASELIPRTRQRVLEPALPVGPPAWVTDEDFQLDYHLRRTHLAGDATLADLLVFTQNLALDPFDRNRPLWEATLIEGLPEGRAAYVLKMHHSLTDGLGGIQLLSLVQSRVREHTPDKPTATVDGSGSGPSDPMVLALAEIGEQARRVPGVAGAALRSGRSVLTDVGGTVSEAVRYAASLRRVLSPPPARPSPLLRGRNGKDWRFGVLECSLAGLKAAGRAGGGSVNDAFVAALLGGLRRYHERHDVDLDQLPMAMPISLRKADDPMGGNKFAGALFAAPMGLADPAERVAAIRGLVISLRAEPALDTFSVVAPVVNRLPSAVGAAAARLGGAADLSASNVPGVPYQTYLAGARVDRVFPFGPLPGVAIMAAMVSHAGTCCVGLNVDGGAVTDHDVLMDCFAQGLDEVLALGTPDTGAHG